MIQNIVLGFKMPGSRCVVQDCSNGSKSTIGISLHSTPVNIRDRDSWVRFVRTHRSNFNPAGRFMVWSVHFESSCFERPVHIIGSRQFVKPARVSIPTPE